MGCTVLLMVACAGVRSEASQEEEQGHTQATEQEQEHSDGAASEEDPCGGTRRILRFQSWFYLTNDVPGCPKGGVLSGTDGPDQSPDRGLDGNEGDDKIRGLGGSDEIYGGPGSDVVYGGPGNDVLCSEVLDACGDEGNNDDVLYGGGGSDDLYAGSGEEVLYGGDGNDYLYASDSGPGKTAPKDGGRDKLYCGRGWDRYDADPNDYVSSSCEKGQLWQGNKLVDTGGPPLILLAGAALLLGSGLGMSRYVRRRAS